MGRVGLAVGWTVFQLGSREQIFQHNLLALGNLVELVQIDESEAGQSEVEVTLVLEVDAVVVVVHQFSGHQDATEARLATALPAYQQRHEGIAAQLALAQPHGHHRAHPDAEQVGPLLVVVGYAQGQGCHSVFAIPRAHLLQIVVDGVVELDVVGVDIAAYVLVPAADAQLQGAHGDGVARLFRQVLEGESQSCTAAIFGHTSHHVLAQFVALVQKDVDLHRQQGFGRQMTGEQHAFLLLVFLDMLVVIGILEYHVQQLRVAVQRGSQLGQMTGGGHGDARFHAVLSQQGEHGVAPFGLVGDAQGSLVGLVQIEFVGRLHGDETVVVEAVFQIRLGSRLQCLFRCLLCAGIDGEGLWVVVDVGVGGHVADALGQRLQLLDGDTQLTIIDDAGSLVEVLVEEVGALLVEG